MRSVGIYVRRSRDPADLRVSIQVQEKDARRYAAQCWPDVPVLVFADNDLTAADPTVERPGWVALIEAIRAGHIEHIVVREQSRLTRVPAVWEDFCVVCQLAKIDVVHTTMGGQVSVAEGSRLPGRITAVVDAEYAEQTRARVRLAHRALAEEGRPAGRPGYGYRRIEVDGRVAWEPDPVTAPIVQAMVEQVAAGDSLGLVAQRLEANGAPTPRGAKVWHRQTIRSIVTARRIIGQRTHRGQHRPAQWPAIVDRGLWEAAQQALRAPQVTAVDGRTRQFRRTKASHQPRLLSGLAVCALCGTRLVAVLQGTATGQPRAPGYGCPHPTRVPPGCGKVSILMSLLDDHVSAKVEKWLTDPATVERVNAHLAPVAQDPSVALELARVEADLADLAEKWGAGHLLAVEHAAARRVLAERHGNLSAALAAQAPAGPPVTAGELLRVWRSGDVHEKRQVLASVIDGPVRVGRGLRDGHRTPMGERITFRLIG